MPLRFNERDSAISGNLMLAILLVVSLVVFVIYSAEGESGPIHTLQSGVGVAVTPVSSVGVGIDSAEQAAETTLSDLTADPSTMSELKEQNAQLRQMVSDLEEYRQEAQRLAGIQDLKDSYGIEGLTTRIIGISGDSWNRVLTIDKGSDDGISVGLPVMGSSGLVGQIKSVTATTAEVRLLQDASSGVAVLLQSSRAEGLLKGSADGLLYLVDIDEDVEVKVGDVVVTSGLGGGYFRGLIVGSVARIEEGNGQSVRQIVVSPNDTVSGLEEVMVVTGVSSKKNAADSQTSASSSSSSSSSEAASTDGSDEAGISGDASDPAGSGDYNDGTSDELLSDEGE